MTPDERDALQRAADAYTGGNLSDLVRGGPGRLGRTGATSCQGDRRRFDLGAGAGMADHY